MHCCCIMLRLSFIQEHKCWLMRVHPLKQPSQSRAVRLVMMEVVWLFISNRRACLKQQAFRLSVAVLCQICFQQNATRFWQLTIWGREIEEAQAVCINSVEQFFERGCEVLGQFPLIRHTVWTYELQ